MARNVTASRGTWQCSDVVWGVVAALVGSVTLLALDVWARPPILVGCLVGTAVIGGFAAVIASEGRRHRQHGDAWPMAIVRGTGDGLRFLWELLF